MVSKLRILIADDHQVVRHALVRMLQSEPDLEVVGQAANGREAVDLVKQLQPDVVLMDLRMPEMDGFEATRTIHRQSPEVRVVALSMHDQEEVIASAKAAGATAFVSKAATPAELLVAIRDQPVG